MIARLLCCGVALVVSAVAFAADPPTTAPRPNLAPVPAAQAVSTHSPYLTGECAICHQSADHSRPGPVSGGANASCLGCHGEFRTPKAVPGHTASAACTACHNPHNARARALLHR